MDEALRLAATGFHVFPLAPRSKTPMIDNFPLLASRDPEQIRKWWLDPVMGLEQPFNIGISTSRFGDGEALLVVDVDTKEGKRGEESMKLLHERGKILPPTFTQKTPSGGRHLIYRTPVAVRQGVNVLGDGIDIRSKGGYIVAPGSEVELGRYEALELPLALAPDWLVETCGMPRTKTENAGLPLPGLDPVLATERAKEYLKTAPIPFAGARNHTAFIVACRVKDCGVMREECIELLANEWHCEPPLDAQELEHVVSNAYKYGAEPIGVSAAETQFGKLPTRDLTPIEKLNQEYAFILSGGSGRILWETTDQNGAATTEYLTVQAFHQKLAAETITIGDGSVKSLASMWMKSLDRRSYAGVCFEPGKTVDPRYYNLWRGFAVEPLPPWIKPTPDQIRALDMFLEHARENICMGVEKDFRWLMGYFAHLVQHPWEKPGVALVFKGSKGVGKNALVERIGYLLGSHFVVAADRRYLVGNFNSHFEKTLLFVLDEAFWSGDKQAEGVLKNLVTGRDHLIERKGQEAYKVPNRTRVVIIGNEDWIVPASHDERRFAVFNVGEGKKQVRHFFQTMRELMEAGGYAYLLRYLLDFDLKGIDVGEAPKTIGLLEQKTESFYGLKKFWFDCLRQGHVPETDFLAEWPLEISKATFRNATKRALKDQSYKARVPDDIAMGRHLKTMCPSIDARNKRREEGSLVNVYRFPPLEIARKEFEKFIGHEINWEQES